MMEDRSSLERCKLTGGDVYQFGVYTGKSLRFLASQLRRNSAPFGRIFGFDSFQGLPAEVEQVQLQATGAERTFRRGQYNAADALGVHDWDVLSKMLAEYVWPPGWGWPGPVHFVRGYFNESLTADLAQQRAMRPALWVDLDVDQYGSTVQAVDWLVASGLLVPGTYVSYDDFEDSVDTSPPGGAVALAHRDLTEKYGILWRHVFSYHKRHLCWFEVFQVVDIARPVRHLHPAQRHCLQRCAHCAKRNSSHLR